MKATCPECYFEFNVDDDVMLGEVIECSDCGTELEVIEIKEKEIALQKAEAEEEDWGE
ncbi:MAG: lysine biosynthesis protein LysW [Candidatus Helarchaeota archaeon]|nr:lysine biosynthesis protein LysW [Candidatus Helarchaeota archaeon]